MHEHDIEWHYWSRTLEQSQKALSTLSVLPPRSGAGLMQARLLAIYAAYAEYILSLVPLQIEDQYLKVVIHLVDGSNLRITEEWEAGVLINYSYYWLTH